MKTRTILALAVTLCGNAVAGQPGQAPLTERLDPPVRELLRKEMRALADAVDRIPSRLAQGDWKQVEETGNRIHDSFILKQEMTPDQRRHLQETLPKGFKHMDREFHQQAASLADNAAKKDARAAVNTFRDMLRACVDCHRQYAPKRFPGLQQQR